MSGDHHDHSHGSVRAGERYRGRLAAAFGLLAVFMVVEVVAGLATQSLALLSDAGHMLTDVIGLGMSLAAIQLASRGSDRRHQHLRPLPTGDPGGARQRRAAHRRRRSTSSSRPSAGSAIHPRSWRARCSSSPCSGWPPTWSRSGCCEQGAKESLNVEGAYLEVLADTVGSVAVIVAAIVIGLTGWGWVDPSRRHRHRRVDPAADVAGSAPARCGSWSRRRRPAPTSMPSRPGWRGSPASSTSTTCTCGR